MIVVQKNKRKIFFLFFFSVLKRAIQIRFWSKWLISFMIEFLLKQEQMSLQISQKTKYKAKRI